MRFGIGMTQAFSGCHNITYQLFQLFNLRKASIFFPVKSLFAINTDMEIAIYFTRLQRYGFQFTFKGGQKLLRHVGGT